MENKAFSLLPPLLEGVAGKGLTPERQEAHSLVTVVEMVVPQTAASAAAALVDTAEPVVVLAGLAVAAEVAAGLTTA
jgi:hypothetical protein